MTRWLDDVGLPQYKDSFLEARVDGRVLNFLTVDDLFQLKVTNQLHHLSLRRGIQVIELLSFHNILCLLGFTGKQLPAKLPQKKRRARRKRESGGRKEDLQQNILSVEVETQFMQVVHSDVVFWTNHR